MGPEEIDMDVSKAECSQDLFSKRILSSGIREPAGIIAVPRPGQGQGAGSCFEADVC